MLRSKGPVHTLTADDEERALELCAANPDVNVFVAARIREGALYSSPGSLLGYRPDGTLRAMMWASANVVPVECDDAAVEAFAQRMRRRSRYASSVFGPTDAVTALWERLRPTWGMPRSVRRHQPVMSTTRTSAQVGTTPDPLVRRATLDDLDAVVPAAAAMFTEEIGYPPYVGSDARYREAVATLIRRGHTFVRTDDQGRVVFKADVGSVAVGAAQIQGVWVAPEHRGRGIAVPAMAAVVDAVVEQVAPVATLYVNDYNTAARRTYERIGMHEVASFTTVLL